MKRYKEILMYSGGIDSYVGYHYLNEPQTVYFNLNSKYSNKEIDAVFKQRPEIILDNNLAFLGQTEEDMNAHIPFRNLYFAMTAVAKYSDTVYICGLKDDKMTDKNEKVFKQWSDHLSELEEREIRIESPFWEMTKEDVVKWYAEHYNKYKLLDVVSCYSDTDEVYCGKCQCCFRKAVALFTVDITLEFDDDKILDYYYERIGTGTYDERRDYNMKRYIDFVRGE